MTENIEDNDRQEFVGGHEVPVSRMIVGRIYLYKCKRPRKDGGLEVVHEPVEYLGNNKGKRICDGSNSKPFILKSDAVLEIGHKK